LKCKSSTPFGAGRYLFEVFLCSMKSVKIYLLLPTTFSLIVLNFEGCRKNKNPENELQKSEGDKPLKMILIDWDDTLFPSSAFFPLAGEQGITMDPQTAENEMKKVSESALKLKKFLEKESVKKFQRI
jgi:hypothetical protein